MFKQTGASSGAWCLAKCSQHAKCVAVGTNNATCYLHKECTARNPGSNPGWMAFKKVTTLLNWGATTVRKNIRCAKKHSLTGSKMARVVAQQTCEQNPKCAALLWGDAGKGDGLTAQNGSYYFCLNTSDMINTTGWDTFLRPSGEPQLRHIAIRRTWHLAVTKIHTRTIVYTHWHCAQLSLGKRDLPLL